jgi:hypothetical protein
MPTKYTVRVASPVQYEYWEAESDTFEEMLAAEQELRELKEQGQAAQAAVSTVKKTFGQVTEVKPAGAFGKGRQAQQSEPEEVELGEHDGYKVYAKRSKFGGVYYRAYKKGEEAINSKSVKGMTVSQATLEQAIELLSEAA